MRANVMYKGASKRHDCSSTPAQREDALASDLAAAQTMTWLCRVRTWRRWNNLRRLLVS